MRSRSRVAVGWVLGLVVIACGPGPLSERDTGAQSFADAAAEDADGLDAGADVDGGDDGGSGDSGADAGDDAGSVGMDGGPSLLDGGIDGGEDAGPGLGVDASHDAGTDAGHDAGIDAGHDSGIDAGHDAGHDAGIDAGHDAGIDGGDLCARVTCEGSPCRTSSCDPATGACVPGVPRPDGTACDDGNACTRGDTCRFGTCVAGDPIVCAPIDACHAAGVCDPAIGACTSPPMPCANEVLVRVRDARGGVLPTPPIVRAFVGDAATPHGGQTDASGEIRLTLPAGSYRFRALRGGLPFWSGATDHCTMPSCTVVEMRLPDSTPDRVVSWDPLMDGAYDGMGEIVPPDPHVQRGGTYLENWAIDEYGRPDAYVASGHTHIFPQPWDSPDPYGNPTEYENQHAFGEMLQGIFVRLDTHGPFDLISIDYRTREDADPEHVSRIPGADPGNVEIWISTVLTVPTSPFHRYPTGKAFNVAMSYWGTVFPSDIVNVTGVYITTTGNVSIDNVVIRPR